MPKKTKKGRRSVPAPVRQNEVRATTAGTASVPQAGTESSVATSRSTVATRAAATAKVDLAREYHYVFADLRKIAIIAVVMFALLFALAFVLR